MERIHKMPRTIGKGIYLPENFNLQRERLYKCPHTPDSHHRHTHTHTRHTHTTHTHHMHTPLSICKWKKSRVLTLDAKRPQRFFKPILDAKRPQRFFFF